MSKFINKKYIKEDISPERINLKSFDAKTELNPKIWDNYSLRPEVRKKLLFIAKEFYDSLKIETKIVDAVVIGSMASYNWSKYSDIDLHLVVDFSKVNMDQDLVRNYFTAKKCEWNENHPELTIHGYEVELYVQDVNESNASKGCYSLRFDHWLKIPTCEKIEMNKAAIKVQAAKYINLIDKLERQFLEGSYNDIKRFSNKVKLVYNRIVMGRKEGLAREGEGSLENIVFKVLRRSNHLGKMRDLKFKVYDKMNSIY